jgi:hypothetical protein
MLAVDTLARAAALFHNFVRQSSGQFDRHVHFFDEQFRGRLVYGRRRNTYAAAEATRRGGEGAGRRDFRTRGGPKMLVFGVMSRLN